MPKEMTALMQWLEYREQLEKESLTSFQMVDLLTAKATSLLPVEKEQRINDILAGMKFFGVDITAPANIAIAEKIHNQNFTQ